MSHFFPQDPVTAASTGLTVNAAEKEILDLLILKHWALRYATNAACTILRVDQIIMAKRAGGPKARPGNGPMDDGDDD
jgi:T-complex protein 1 subunit theta